MNRNILVPAAAVLALLSPAAARAQGYHWLQQPWHLKTIYLTARITTIASSSDNRPSFLKESDRVIGLMENENTEELVQRFRAVLVARDGAHMNKPWSEYRVEMIKTMSAVAYASSNTPSMAVFFARFDDLIFAGMNEEPVAQK